MKDAYGRADGDVLVGVERAARTGRRVTARHARRQKRSSRSSRGWTIGSLTISPLVTLAVVALLLAGVAGAAVALGGHSSGKQAISVTAPRRSTASTRPAPSPSSAPAARAVYIRYTDAATVVHYMYCTKVDGCGILDVAKDGTSKLAVTSLDGVWHRVQRDVIKHDPCIDIIQNGAPIGKPGDLVATRTTNLRGTGTQTIKGIPVPARLTGTIAWHFDYPIVPQCTFSQSDFTQRVDSPVTEYVPKSI